MKEKRENRVTIRLTNRELALLKANNSNMSVFIRDAALEKADKYKIIEDEEIIELENEEKLLKGKLDFLKSNIAYYKKELSSLEKEYNTTYKKIEGVVETLENKKQLQKLEKEPALTKQQLSERINVFNTIIRIIINKRDNNPNATINYNNFKTRAYYNSVKDLKMGIINYIEEESMDNNLNVAISDNETITLNKNDIDHIRVVLE
ncbi:hypothetical protein [Methanosphaera stadtmanae]|uniref:hypothetical protein n=1 Tax=Methanosphaera stadtmanae TaxID=2317 RepID=UPI002666B595|nr:hypothetical protein [Methanosphaera stadtmanae]